MQAHAGFSPALVDGRNRVATAHHVALAYQRMPQVRVERADLRQVANLHRESESAVRTYLHHDARACRVHRVAHIGHVVNPAVRQFNLGKRVANHLEPVPYSVPVLERVNHREARRQRRIRLDSLQEPLEAALDFAQALPGRERHRFLAKGIVQRKPEPAQLHGAVAQEFRLLRLEDRFVHRLADTLDFFLDGLVLAVNRNDIVCC